MASPPDTLLVNGHDLRAMTGVRVEGDMMLFAPGTRRGSDQIIPGADGQQPAAGLPVDAYSFPISVRILGANRGARNAALFAVAAILQGTSNDALVTLTRRTANASDTGFDEATAPGRFNTGLAMAVLNPFSGKTVFQFVNLAGFWRRTSDNTRMPA